MYRMSFDCGLPVRMKTGFGRQNESTNMFLDNLSREMAPFYRLAFSCNCKLLQAMFCSIRLLKRGTLKVNFIYTFIMFRVPFSVSAPVTFPIHYSFIRCIDVEKLAIYQAFLNLICKAVVSMTQSTEVCYTWIILRENTPYKTNFLYEIV